MHLLIVGSGKGSWEMRGVQLGAALGARETSAPSERDWQWADLAILIKKRAITFAPAAHRAKVPIVWDALDFWSQPSENRCHAARALQVFEIQRRAIKPVLTIAATQAMATDCGGVYLSHHSWQGLTPTPARARVHTVGYDGNDLYLGAWKAVLERACHARGWRFVINPKDLTQVDLLVAFRDGIRDGWICRQWKSGVKLVNAIAAGRPIITQPCAAWDELRPDGSVIDDPRDLDAALDRWSDHMTRSAVVDRAQVRAGEFAVETIAAQYRTILEHKVVRCAA